MQNNFFNDISDLTEDGLAEKKNEELFKIANQAIESGQTCFIGDAIMQYIKNGITDYFTRSVLFHSSVNKYANKNTQDQLLSDLDQALQTTMTVYLCAVTVFEDGSTFNQVIGHRPGIYFSRVFYINGHKVSPILGVCSIELLRRTEKTNLRNLYANFSKMNELLLDAIIKPDLPKLISVYEANSIINNIKDIIVTSIERCDSVAASSINILDTIRAENTHQELLQFRSFALPELDNLIRAINFSYNHTPQHEKLFKKLQYLKNVVNNLSNDINVN